MYICIKNVLKKEEKTKKKEYREIERWKKNNKEKKKQKRRMQCSEKKIKISQHILLCNKIVIVIFKTEAFSNFKFTVFFFLFKPNFFLVKTKAFCNFPVILTRAFLHQLFFYHELFKNHRAFHLLFSNNSAQIQLLSIIYAILKTEHS